VLLTARSASRHFTVAAFSVAKKSQRFVRGLINNNYYQATPEGETKAEVRHGGFCALRITDSGFTVATAESDWRSGGSTTTDNEDFTR